MKKAMCHKADDEGGGHQKWARNNREPAHGEVK